MINLYSHILMWAGCGLNWNKKAFPGFWMTFFFFLILSAFRNLQATCTNTPQYTDSPAVVWNDAESVFFFTIKHNEVWICLDRSVSVHPQWSWAQRTGLIFNLFLCVFVSLQKSKLMFKRLDASTLPEDILSNTQPLPMMAHSAGSALWVSMSAELLH